MKPSTVAEATVLRQIKPSRQPMGWSSRALASPAFGSFSEVGVYISEVRFYPNSRREATAAACPFRAITGSAPLFDHLVSQRENGRGDSDTERLRGFQIDDQSELVRLLYREIAGLRAAKNFGDLTTSATSLILPIC